MGVPLRGSAGPGPDYEFTAARPAMGMRRHGPGRPCDYPAMSPHTQAPTRRSGIRRALIGVGLVLGLLAGCATLDEQQRKWIFQPGDRTWWGGLAAAEGMADVWIEFDSRASGDAVRLHGLWLPQDRADAPVLLYLHGARWDVRGSAHRMRRMHELGFAVLGVDYRGFGRSTRPCRRRRWPTRMRAPPGTGWPRATRSRRAMSSATRWAAPSR